MKIRSAANLKRSIIISVLIFLIFSSIYISSVRGASKAPDFSVKTTEGEFTLSNQSKPVLIDFMTPKCISCKEVENNLKAIYPEFKNKFEFISIDISNKSMSTLEEYKQDREVPWKIGKGNSDLFVNKYQGSFVPMVVIINEDRQITFKQDGVIGKKALKEEINAVLEGEAESLELTNYGIYALALMGGVASFFSPCSFPLLPSYVAYYIRPKDEEGHIDEQKIEDDKERSVKTIKGLTLGFQAAFGIVLVFGVVGFITITGGHWISDYLPYLEPLIGGIILILGSLMLADIDVGTKIKMKIQSIGNRFRSEERSKPGFSSPFLYGLGYGSSAAGCTAPVFIAVVLSSWLSDGLYGAFIVLLLYISMMAVLMILFSVITVYFREKIISRMKGTIKWINKGAALVLMGAGLYMIYLFFVTF